MNTTNDRARNTRQFIFPSINFTCSGYITKWTFYARFNNSDPSTYTLYPEFQIWRINSSLNGYTKVGYTSIDSDTELNGTFQNGNINQYIYNVNFSEAMSVQPGDIVGVSTPKTRGNGTRSRLRLRFNRQSQDGPPSYYYNLTGSELPVSFFNLSVATTTQSFLPVISAQIVVFPPESIAMSVSVSQSSTSAKISTEKVQQTSFSSGTDASSIITVSQSMPGTADSPQSSGSALTVAVAAGVSAAVVLIVLTFLVVALVVCIRKSKQKKTSYITNTTTATLDNPTYDSNSNGNFSM